MAAEIRCNKEHRYSIALIDEDKPRTCPFCAADELQRLRAELEKATNGRDNYKALFEQAIKRETKLAEHIVTLQADALRYRWLRTGAGIVEAVEQKRMATQPFCIIPTKEASLPLYGPELDAAIDSAIEEAKK